MAEEDAVELHREREVAERARAVGAERAGVSAAVTAASRRGGLGRADRRGDLALAVAADQCTGRVERLEASSVARANGPGDDVAADHHRVGAGRARVGEDGVERVDVAVDVVQREDPHGRPMVTQPQGCDV